MDVSFIYSYPPPPLVFEASNSLCTMAAPRCIKFSRMKVVQILQYMKWYIYLHIFNTLIYFLGSGEQVLVYRDHFQTLQPHVTPLQSLFFPPRATGCLPASDVMLTSLTG
jgi:hypothetical protein